MMGGRASGAYAPHLSPGVAGAVAGINLSNLSTFSLAQSKHFFPDARYHFCGGWSKAAATAGWTSGMRVAAAASALAATNVAAAGHGVVTAYFPRPLSISNSFGHE